MGPHTRLSGGLGWAKVLRAVLLGLLRSPDNWVFLKVSWIPDYWQSVRDLTENTGECLSHSHGITDTVCSR